MFEEEGKPKKKKNKKSKKNKKNKKGKKGKKCAVELVDDGCRTMVKSCGKTVDEVLSWGDEELSVGLVACCQVPPVLSQEKESDSNCRRRVVEQ